MKLSRRSIVILRQILLAVVVVVTLAALFVVEENWRGDRAWTEFKRNMQARGEPLDFKEFQHAPVPDEQNFFKAPMLSRVLYERRDDADRQKILHESRLTTFVFGLVKSGRDLPAFAKRLREVGLISEGSNGSAGEEILRAMHPLQPLLDDIRQAARTRPLALREPNPGAFTGLIDPNTVWMLGQALAVRAWAEIEVGGAADAYADIVAMQCLANALSTDPTTLLNLMIGTAIHSLASRVISEGLNEQIWTDETLAAFQQGVIEFKPLLRLRNAMRMERAQVLTAFDQSAARSGSHDTGAPFWLFYGWRQQNKLAFCQDLDGKIMSAFTIEPPRIFLNAPQRSETRSSVFQSPYRWLARFTLGNYENIFRELAKSADRLTLCSAAWAIERHRLVKGAYPQTLDKLVPQFMKSTPSGIIDGQAARYTPMEEASYKLWFVGPNGTDDGGRSDDILLPTTES